MSRIITQHIFPTVKNEQKKKTANRFVVLCVCEYMNVKDQNMRFPCLWPSMITL